MVDGVWELSSALCCRFSWFTSTREDAESAFTRGSSFIHGSLGYGARVQCTLDPKGGPLRNWTRGVYFLCSVCFHVSWLTGGGLWRSDISCIVMSVYVFILVGSCYLVFVYPDTVCLLFIYDVMFSSPPGVAVRGGGWR